MAFFKFRKGGDEPSATPLLPDTLEAMRRRAKFRLIGSAVLVLIGVIGFPMLFDKQPRPISVDMPIEIPDRNKVKPLAIPVPASALIVAQAPKPELAASAAPALPAAPVVAAINESKVPAPLASSSQAAINKVASPAPVTAAKPIEKAIEKAAPAPKPAAKADEGSKAQALLDGHSIDKNNEAIVGRFVVQVGAFADVTKAREARLKLEHAGLKTYTQVAETKEGHRIRVRVGPFGTKAEADKAVDKVKHLKLPALLTL